MHISDEQQHIIMLCHNNGSPAIPSTSPVGIVIEYEPTWTSHHSHTSNKFSHSHCKFSLLQFSLLLLHCTIMILNQSYSGCEVRYQNMANDDYSPLLGSNSNIDDIKVYRALAAGVRGGEWQPVQDTVCACGPGWGIAKCQVIDNCHLVPAWRCGICPW